MAMVVVVMVVVEVAGMTRIKGATAAETMVAVLVGAIEIM